MEATLETLAAISAAWRAECDRDFRSGVIGKDAYLLRMSSEHRLPAIIRWYRRREVTARQLHTLLRTWWTSTDRVHPNTGIALRLFRAANRVCGLVADSPLPDWPEEITIFRAAGDSEVYDLFGNPRGPTELGISWTLDRECAVRFTQDRFHHGARQNVVSATILTAAVLGWFDERGEREVVINPACLRGVEVA